MDEEEKTPEWYEGQIEMLRGAIEGWRSEHTRLTAEIAALREDKVRLFDLLNWQTHLFHGVGKDGGEPSSAEWEDCQSQCRAAIDEAREER